MSESALSRTIPNHAPRSDDWFDDQEIGRTYLTVSRTVTEADINLFGGMTGDLSELHTSEAYAKTTEFGGRIAHGMLALSLMHGLVVRAGHLAAGGIALLGWNDVRFHAPVKIGDTMRARWTTIGKRDSGSRPDAGIVTDKVELFNQDGLLVVSGEMTELVRKRPV